MRGLRGKPRRAALYGAAVVIVGGAVYWAALPELPRRSAAVSVNEAGAFESMRVRSANAHSRSAVSAPKTREQEQPRAMATVDTEAATVAQYTAQKYQLLLDDLHSSRTDRDHLQAALFQREQLTGLQEGPAREKALAEADAQIRGMLHPADFATFDVLKDSDLEQFELEDYAGGVSNVAPLSPEDRRAILRTKLAYKGRFRQLVQDSGLLRTDLTPAERDYAYDVASRALRSYQDNYLQEMRQYLANDEQYTLLSNYESTRFTAELAKLQAMANGG